MWLKQRNAVGLLAVSQLVLAALGRLDYYKGSRRPVLVLKHTFHSVVVIQCMSIYVHGFVSVSYILSLIFVCVCVCVCVCVLVCVCDRE